MMKRLLLLSCLALAAMSSGYAQRTISGVVTDTRGELLIGVNILEEGTSNGTVTDLDGRYSLTLTETTGNLIFSYTGMESTTLPVGVSDVLDVEMRASSALLDEVVVTALGFTENRDEMGSTSTIIDEEAVARSGEATLLNGLGAKASNVRINRSNGDPGAGSTIRIRGANTIDGDGDPLIIVDGVPLNNSTVYGGGNNVTGGRAGGTSQQSRINDINPNDIESIQILKGASAAALWGSRAANGVIVITTKNGNAGKPNISYQFSASFDLVSERIPMQNTWGQGRDGSFRAGVAESWGDFIPDRAGGQDLVNTEEERFIAEDGTEYFPIEEKRDRSTFVDENWDAVFQTGKFFQHDLSINGGGEKATYFFSLGRLDQDGIIKNSDYERTNIRLNNQFILTDWLTLSTRAAFTTTSSNRIQQSSNTAGLMLGLLRTAPDFDNRDYIGTHIDEDGETFNRRHRSYRRPLGDRDNPTYNNPLWTVNEQEASTKVNRIIFTPQFTITPLNWLQVILRGNADVSGDKRQYFFPIGSGGDRSVGILAEDVIGIEEYNFDAIARGNFNLGRNVDLRATLGYNLNDRRIERNSGQITGFLVNATKPTTALNTANENSEYENNRTIRRSNRGYAILGVDLFDQLFLNVSGGLEAASSVNGSFFYPAVDGAWDFTKSFLQSNFLSFGKLRGSWGQVGVQPRAHAFQTLAEGGFTYSSYSDPLSVSQFGGGFRVDNNQGNTNLEPEIKTEWEIGADLRFFQDKLGVSYTYYSNEIDGILIDVEVSPSSGFATTYGNFGTMENQGHEIDLNYNAITKPDYNLNFFLNWSKNENLVTSLSGAETIDLTGQSVSSRAIAGQPMGVLYGTGSQVDEEGNFILDDNGFPQITNSPVPLGDPNPDWRGGVGFNFRWKNLGLNVLLEHSQGGVFSPRTLWVLNRFGTTAETAGTVTLGQDLVNYGGDVISAGTTVRGNVTDFGGGPVLLDETWYRTGIGGGFGDNQAYNFSIKDATFTKFREITLSYTITGPKMRESIALQGITLRATARNLFFWDQIEGIDPETSQTGVGNGLGLEYFTNPQTRSFLLTAIVNFKP